jgi:cell division transport system permease protein
MFVSLKRIIGLGWQNLVRDGGIAVANIFIMMIPILLATSLFFIKDISAFLVSTLREKADVSVYFSDSASEDDILKLQSTISQMDGIAKVDYISKDNALEAFSARHQQDPTLMESLQQVNGNPFLASLTVRAADFAQYGTVQTLLSSDQYKDMVSKVNYNEKKDVIDKIFSLTSQATRVGLILFAALGAISTLVTFNTVRIAIINRREEIEVQRLVGASRWFVRGQFLVEGLIFGVLAATFCFIIAAVVCWYASPPLGVLIPGINLWANFYASMWLLVGIQLGIGGFLGIASGAYATGKYLKI